METPHKANARIGRHPSKKPPNQLSAAQLLPPLNSAWVESYTPCLSPKKETATPGPWTGCLSTKLLYPDAIARVVLQDALGGLVWLVIFVSGFDSRCVLWHCIGVVCLEYYPGWLAYACCTLRRVGCESALLRLIFPSPPDGKVVVWVGASLYISGDASRISAVLS